MNTPNKLTLLRIVLIPFFMAVIIFCEGTWSNIVAAALFGLTALTDMLDGKIARKYGLVTDFGKFLDPVADKLMIIGAYLSILTRLKADNVFYNVFTVALFIVIVREITVTSLRMIASNKSSVVIAASYLGKIKTVSQICCVLIMLLEPVFLKDTFFAEYSVLGYVSTVFMTVMTLVSGANYFKSYWKLLDPQK